MEFMQHRALKTLGGMLLDFIGVSTCLVFFIACDAHGAPKKEKKVVYLPPETYSSHEEHMRDCLRKISKQRCDMLIEAQKNLDEIKKRGTESKTAP